MRLKAITKQHLPPFKTWNYSKNPRLDDSAKILLKLSLVHIGSLWSLRSPRWLFTIAYPTRAHGMIANYQFHFIFMLICQLTSRQIQHSSCPESGLHLCFPWRRLSRQTLHTSQWNDLSWWMLRKQIRNVSYQRDVDLKLTNLNMTEFWDTDDNRIC